MEKVCFSSPLVFQLNEDSLSIGHSPTDLGYYSSTATQSSKKNKENSWEIADTAHLQFEVTSPFADAGNGIFLSTTAGPQ